MKIKSVRCAKSIDQLTALLSVLEEGHSGGQFARLDIELAQIVISVEVAGFENVNGKRQPGAASQLQKKITEKGTGRPASHNADPGTVHEFP